MLRGTVVLIGVWLLVCSPGVACTANDGLADHDLLIDELTTYPSADAAQRACGGATVVWADRYSGFYYDSHEPKYGTTHDGSYACEADAKKARYWSTDPRGSMDGHTGRIFPFDPIYVGS